MTLPEGNVPTPEGTIQSLTRAAGYETLGSQKTPQEIRS
jgi:hypothetical protein